MTEVPVLQPPPAPRPEPKIRNPGIRNSLAECGKGWCRSQITNLNAVLCSARPPPAASTVAIAQPVLPQAASSKQQAASIQTTSYAQVRITFAALLCTECRRSPASSSLATSTPSICDSPSCLLGTTVRPSTYSARLSSVNTSYAANPLACQ
jgi:hypothetical protein